MNETMKRALDAQHAAEAALEAAKAATRDVAMQQYQEALDACEAAGVVVNGGAQKRAGRGRAKGFRLSDEQRIRAAERARESWARKSPEARAAWVASITGARRKVNGSEAVQ